MKILRLSYASRDWIVLREGAVAVYGLAEDASDKELADLVRHMAYAHLVARLADADGRPDLLPIPRVGTAIRH